MSNSEFLFQMGMVAKMIEARHKDGCKWSVEFVLRDAAGRIIMQCGDEPQPYWQSTIPPPKESVGPVPPAVSESAAGDWPGPDWSQAPEWAMWWAKDSDMPNAIWWRDQPDMSEKGYWTVRDLHHHGFAYVNAPSFGYRGHWRDSLRKRP